MIGRYVRRRDAAICTQKGRERRNRKCEEQHKILRKVESEERYFTEKMSLDDCQRFQAMLNLHSELARIEEEEIFSYGFAMGATLMLDIMDEVEAMKDEK